MPLRTSWQTIDFARPFTIAGNDEVFPEGAYDVETDEELIEGLSFAAYRRVAVFVHLHPHAGRARTMTVDPAAFDAAVARDRSGAPEDEKDGPGC